MFHVIAFVFVSHTLPVSAMHHLPSISLSLHCPHYSPFAAIGQEHSFIRVSQPIRDLNKSSSPNSFKEIGAHLSTSGLPVITLGGSSSILNLALDTLFISLLPLYQKNSAYTKSLSGGGVVDELGFDQVGEVCEGFGLFISLQPKGKGRKKLHSRGPPS